MPSAIRHATRRPSDALREGARGTENLLALAIEAARAKATVGEISDAMEDVFGRHAAKPDVVTGIYRKTAGDTDAIMTTRALVSAFAENEGRRPRTSCVKPARMGTIAGRR